tara:strand:- start:2287 stop:6669 length:4383 start_codon:yes stop_codon:yes gene_type:complete
MKDQQINSFGKGMMKDLSSTIPQEGSYVDAQNIRIISDGSGAENGSGIVVDVKGNKLVLNLESVSIFQDLYPDWYVMWGSTGYLTSSSVIADGGQWLPHTFILVQDIFSSQAYIYFNNSLNPIYLNYGSFSYDTLAATLLGELQTALNAATPFTIVGGMGIGAGDVELYNIVNALDDVVNVTILGHTTIRNTLVLFCILTFTSDSAFDATMSSIITCDLDDVSLTPDVVYTSAGLNFSPDYPIEAIGRYESEEVQRVYWTDNLNPVRTLNIVGDTTGLVPDDLGLTPSVVMGKIKVTSVINQGSLPEGSYQYSYRLSSPEGALTKFSTPTSPIHIVDGSLYWLYDADPENNQEYSSRIPGEPTNKLVNVTVSDIDVEYTFIEVAVIYKNAPDAVDSVYLLPKTVITSSDSMHFSHSTDVGVPITIEEVTSFLGVVENAKTLEAKDNRLFLGNCTISSPELEFNARAYRYKRNDGVIHPWEAAEGAVSTYVSNPLEEEMSEEDAINPYNLLGEVDDPSSHYKFKSDGVTLGGEGPHVTYKFIKKKLSGNTLEEIPSIAPFVTSVFAAPSSVNNGKPGDYKSPTNVSDFLGYQRDEIYRFGIVLHDKHGNPGFVNWIGDIRFPDYQDYDHEGSGGINNYVLSRSESPTLTGNGTNYNLNYGTPNAYQNMGDFNLNNSSGYDVHHGSFDNESQTWGGASSSVLFALGISFDVNLPPEVMTKISGYSIVRMQRKEGDKTTLGSGAISFMAQFAREAPSQGEDSWAAFAHSMLYRDFHEGYAGQYQQNITFRNFIGTLDSPDFPFLDSYPENAEGTVYLKVTGAMMGKFKLNYDNPSDDTGPYNLGNVLGSHKLANEEGNLFKTYPLLYTGKLARGGSVISNPLDPDSFEYDYISASGTTDFSGFFNKQYHLGISGDDLTIKHDSIGEETLLFIVKMGEETSITNDQGDNVSNYAGIDWSNWIAHEDTEPYTNQQIPGARLMGAVKRDLLGEQYGGNTHYKRSQSSYISTGHYTSVGDTSQQAVWGGDTYVTVYDISKARRHDADLDPYSGGGDDRDSICYAYPVESVVNTTLRGGVHFANKTNHAVESGGVAVQILNHFILAPVHSVLDVTTTYIPKPEVYFSNLTTFDTRVLYSDVKINNASEDGWRVFKLENYRDVETGSGPLVKLMTHKDSMFFLQERGFGALVISPVSTTVDTDGVSIVLGTGEVIQTVNYISTVVGSQDIRGIVNTTKGIYWVDKKTKKAYAFRANGLDSISDTHGMKSWFSSNIDTGSEIVLGNDVINDEVLFSVEDKTLAFSEVLNKFTSFYTYGTPMYINTFDRLFSIYNDGVSKVYEHNIGNIKTFYGDATESYVEFLVNKHALETKVFDNLEWYTEGSEANADVISSAVFTDSNNQTYVDFYDTTSVNYFPYKKVKEQKAKTPVPRTPANYRFRDTYMKVKLVTSSGSRMILHYVKTFFRISKR